MNSPNVCCLDHVDIKFTLFTVCTIKPTLHKVWIHRHYVAYSMVPLSLRCLNNGSIKIKLTLFTLQTNLTYLVYRMEPLKLRYLLHGSINLRCLQYKSFNLTLFTLWTQHSYIVYSMGPSHLPCLHYGISKLTVSTVQPYPALSTTRYTETRHKMTSVIVTVIRAVLTTVLSI